MKSEVLSPRFLLQYGASVLFGMLLKPSNLGPKGSNLFLVWHLCISLICANCQKRQKEVTFSIQLLLVNFLDKSKSKLF